MDSNIFIDFLPCEKIKNERDAFKYLKAQSLDPFFFRKLKKSENTCVEIFSVGAPKVIVGLSPPSGDPVSDLNKILAWLEENKIRVALVD